MRREAVGWMGDWRENARGTREQRFKKEAVASAWKVKRLRAALIGWKRKRAARRLGETIRRVLGADNQEDQVVHAWRAFVRVEMDARERCHAAYCIQRRTRWHLFRGGKGAMPPTA